MTKYTESSNYLEDKNQKNTGELYYRKYYPNQDIIDNTFASIPQVNRDIQQIEIRKIPKLQEQDNIEQKITFATTYPGLIVGSGYLHEAKSEIEKYKENAFKIGFYFDYTTGMPVISGSSVKGVIRSMFPNQSKDEKTQADKDALLRYFLKELEENCKNLNPEMVDFADEVDIKALENEIFEGILPDGKRLSNYKRDTFLDAVPIGTLQSNSVLFGEDYITPHRDEENPAMSPFKNPNPIKFLKVMPGIVYEFRFMLQKSNVCEPLTPQLKIELFKKILLWNGIGAKTNVGYGQFEDLFPTVTNNGRDADNANIQQGQAQGSSLEKQKQDKIEANKDKLKYNMKVMLSKNSKVQGIISNINMEQKQIDIELFLKNEPDAAFARVQFQGAKQKDIKKYALLDFVEIVLSSSWNKNATHQNAKNIKKIQIE